MRWVGDEERSQRGLQVNLNAPVGIEEEGRLVDKQWRSMNVEVYQDGVVTGEDTMRAVQSGTQDSDPFKLGPIIAAVKRKSRQLKRRIAEVVEEVKVLGEEDSSVQHKMALIFF